MSSKTKRQKSARALQEETGWAYSRCLNLLDTKTPEELDVLVAEAKKTPPIDDRRTKAQKARSSEH